MCAYLMDFEKIIGAKSKQSCTCIETTHRQSQKKATLIYEPKQIGGEDCEVYACTFADLISQRRIPAEEEKAGSPTQEQHYASND